MNQQDPPSTDLTPWTSGAPPMIGWWATRPTDSGDLITPYQRRWWDGRCWGLMVLRGESDEDAEWSRVTQSQADDIEWCGLPFPAPEGYPYMVDTTTRTKIARRLKPKPKARRRATLKE